MTDISTSVGRGHKTRLLAWFQKNQRPLPWRKTKDPYRVWISETMLQQTTCQAVIPYYERFVKELPNVSDLARAPEKQVLQLWSGLGYYSRARNLHKAAQQIDKMGTFPSRAHDLLKLPGFGPYTSRAVSSIAFGEVVGVLDGNVIRVLCRFHGLRLEWWKTSNRKLLQGLADKWVQETQPQQTNQALMELGATICTPQSPSCLLCPLRKDCRALESGVQLELPLARPKRQREMWIWESHMIRRGQKWAFLKNDYAPFLRGQWLFPGKARKVQRAPKTFDFRHTITHHDIYVRVKNEPVKAGGQYKWIQENQIKEFNPTSLVQKALQHIS